MLASDAFHFVPLFAAILDSFFSHSKVSNLVLCFLIYVTHYCSCLPSSAVLILILPSVSACIHAVLDLRHYRGHSKIMTDVWHKRVLKTVLHITIFICQVLQCTDFRVYGLESAYLANAVCLQAVALGGSRHDHRSFAHLCLVLFFN